MMLLLMEYVQDFAKSYPKSFLLIVSDINKSVDFCGDWVWGWLTRGSSSGTD